MIKGDTKAGKISHMLYFGLRNHLLRRDALLLRF